MGLTMRERHAVTRELTDRYQKASKKERGAMLNDFCTLTGYSRYHARFILRNCGKQITKMVERKRVVFTVAQARKQGASRQRAKRYGGAAFLEALKRLWALSDGLCGKRLKAFLRETLPHLEHASTLAEIVPHAEECLRHLETVSAATLDRLLAPTRQEARLKGRSGTRAGSLLKYHIPVRTFAQWNETAPGFCEVDLVGHDGGCLFGQFCQTLTLTDIASGWTETKALQNKAEKHVKAALEEIRTQVPFALQGIDCDNGSEFINGNLLRYCAKAQITFTRSRPYKKNDNCFVEQKNNSIVRRTVGYYRYESGEQLTLLNELYDRLRLYTNFFLPVMRLKEKHREGSRLTRRYDAPCTPYRRLLQHPELPQERKELLHQQYAQLDLVRLKRQINELQERLFHSALAAPPLPKRWSTPAADHPWRACADPSIQATLAQTSAALRQASHSPQKLSAPP